MVIFFVYSILKFRFLKTVLLSFVETGNPFFIDQIRFQKLNLTTLYKYTYLSRIKVLIRPFINRQKEWIFYPLMIVYTIEKLVKSYGSN